MSEELIPKYDNLEKMSRSQRDNAIFQQLEILANTMERIQKVINRIETKI